MLPHLAMTAATSSTTTSAASEVHHGRPATIVEANWRNEQ